MSRPEPALILLVHGSRDESWLAPFRELARTVAQDSKARVELACLQFCPPDLETTIGRLAGQGATELRVVPWFLSGLGHVLKDVPRTVEAARRNFPGVRIEILPALGEQPEIREAARACLLRLAAGN